MKSFDKTQDLRVALVHDYIKEYGGAERVLEALHEIWPDAPVYTSVYLPEFLGPHKERFNPSASSGWNIKTSWLQYLPFKAKLISPIRLIAPLIFRQFDFSNFDVVVVSSTGAYSKILNTKYLIHNTIQVAYCHTPPRYLYGFATAREWKKNPILRSIGEIANHFLRLVDFKSAQNVDFFIANSVNVQKRIEKFYKKDSTVIYPPVDVARRQPHVSDDARLHDLKTISNSASLSKIRRQSEIQPNFSSSESGLSPRSYFLAGGRIARPKHIDLIVESFAKLKLPLKVFGRSFASSPNILISQYPNISFLGEISDQEKIELMRNAKAFVFAAEDEDFGITPVEAMSVGTPVIAFASGGVLETIVDGKTGVLYRFNDLNHLSEAIRKFEKMKFNREEIVKYAQKFSKERFKKEIKDFVESHLEI